MNIIETRHLGKRYGNTWGLRNCTLTIPGGHVAALVGPNGAGKTTLLHILVGLASASEGSATVLGGNLAGSRLAMEGVAFVGQDAPMYRNLSADEMLQVACSLNRRFDDAGARDRLKELGIPAARPAGSMSGGQRAQLALVLALARHPRLLVLDEPMARLDPLARHDFMATLMTAVADDGLSVLLTSHMLAELERVADYLVVLSHGGVQLAGEVSDLIDQHRVLTGPVEEVERYAERMNIVHVRRGEAQAHLLIRTHGTTSLVPRNWEDHPVSLEELAIAYLREPGAGRSDRSQRRSDHVLRAIA